MSIARNATARDDTSPLANDELSTPTPNTAPKDMPLPFLKLPAELRLMVYERIPIRISEHRRIHLVHDVIHPVTYIVPCLSINILATSRDIRREAMDILNKKLRTMYNTPLRVVISTTLLSHLHSSFFGLFRSISLYMIKVQLIVARGVQPEPDDYYDMKATRAQARSQTCLKWVLHIEKKRSTWSGKNLRIQDINIEIGLRQHKGDSSPKKLLDWVEGGCQRHRYLNCLHRPTRDHTPGLVLLELENRGRALIGTGRWSKLLTGNYIETAEYKKEWCADERLAFPRPRSTE